MDDTGFDRITQRLADEASRRRMLSGIVGATAVLLTGATTLAAKGGQGKSQGKKGNPSGKSKVNICHLDEETRLFTFKQVPATSVKGHQRHGDHVVGVTDATDCDALNQTEE